MVCRMTYCVEHPTRKMLLVPVEPAEPNPRCYVCSEVCVCCVHPVNSALIDGMMKLLA